MAANSDQIRKTVALYLDLMNAGDPDPVAELYAQNATIEDPIGSEKIRGREAIRKFYARAIGRVTLESTGNPRVAAGQVAFPMHGQLDKTTPLEIIVVMVFDDDGKITSMRAFWNEDEA